MENRLTCWLGWQKHVAIYWQETKSLFLWMKSYVILFDGRRPLESSIKKDSGFLMDVNNSMRKRFFPVMFYCFILSSGSSLSKCDVFAWAVERPFPKEKCHDSLVFVRSVKCCLDCLCERIFRFGISIMEIIIMMLCFPKALFFTTNHTQESSKI